jgi:hypothetical protein
LEFLLNHNLVKGGDLDNAIVIIDKDISQTELDRLADLFHHKRVEVKPQGILNNLELHYDNDGGDSKEGIEMTDKFKNKFVFKKAKTYTYSF